MISKGKKKPFITERKIARRRDTHTPYRRKATAAKSEPIPRATFIAMLLTALEPVGDGEGAAAAPVELVPLSWLASCWKAVKLRGEFCMGLTAKTIPAPQWEEPSGLCCLHCSRNPLVACSRMHLEKDKDSRRTREEQSR